MASRAAGSGTGRRRRGRRVGTAKLVAVAVAVSAITMITMTASAVITKASCSDKPILVNVAVSNDIAPAIQAVARAFNNQNLTADGRCAQVQITEGDSAAEAGQIDGQAPQAGLPQVQAWIPDSSLWLDIVRSYPVGAQNVQPTGQSVARSPLLMVTTASVAAKTHLFDSQPGWNALLPPFYGGPAASLGLAVDLPDPTDSSAGLAALVEIGRTLGTSQQARNAFTKFAYSVQVGPRPFWRSALQTFVQSTRSADRPCVTVATAGRWVYDRANLRARLIIKASPTRADAGTPGRTPYGDVPGAAAGRHRVRQLPADQERHGGGPVLRLSLARRRAGRHARRGGTHVAAASAGQCARRQ